jgi:hypothetical protein
MARDHTTRRRLLGSVAGVAGAVGIGLSGRAVGQKTHHLLVFGGSPSDPVRYAFGVEGRVEKTGSAGPAPVADHRVSADPDDHVRDGDGSAWVEGGVAGGADAYEFTGDLRRFAASVTADTTDRVRVYLDGERVQPADLSGAASSPITFLDCERARMPGDLGDGEVHVSTMGPQVGLDTLILGLPDESGVYRPDVDAPAVSLDSVSYGGPDDRQSVANPYVGPWCLAYHLVVVGGTPDAPASYEFAVRQSVRQTRDVGDVPVSRATVDDEDVIEERDGRVTARGAVAGGADAYYVSGELLSFALDGDADVYLAGERVSPDELGR